MSSGSIQAFDGREASTAKFPWMRDVLDRLARIEAQPLPRNIWSLLEEAAAQAPDAAAIHVIAGNETVTYTALRDKVRDVAAGLLSIGVEKGSRVGVMLANVMEMPLTWLALARIGAVMVPINTRYTSRELHYVLSDSEASYLVIAEDLLPILAPMEDELPHLKNRTVVVGQGSSDGRLTWQEMSQRSAGEMRLAEPRIDDLMNIQYTSGTTGWPKGCLLTQRYWLTCAKAYSDCDGKSYKNILAGNPFFYMTPQWLLLMAFFQRATLHVASHRSLTHYMEWIRTYGIDFSLVPFDVLTQRPPEPSDPVSTLVRGNIYIHAKERHAEMEQRFNFPARTAFGMTEIGMGTFMPLEAVEMTGSGSCGIAGPFRECRIADPEGMTLRRGQAGELLIRGSGLFQGYFHKPEATAAAFHEDWFRTGDLAVQDEHGFFHIVGRIKEMIRRAGENISAAEVEAVLLMIPEVREAAAVPVPDELRGEEVKAYLVLKDGLDRSDLPPEKVMAHCERQLAVFKIPRYLEYRASPLPRSTSGKVRKPDLLNEKADLREGSWDRLHPSVASAVIPS